MNQRDMATLFGAVLVALAVFITGSGFAFDTGELYSSVALVQLVVGLGIALCILFKQRTWALYFTIAATTIMAIGLVDLFRQDGPGLTLGFVILAAGVVLALVGTVRRGAPKDSTTTA